jgi:hypothetical protein
MDVTVVAAVLAAVTTFACSSDSQPAALDQPGTGGAPSVDGGSGGSGADAKAPPSGCMRDDDCTPEMECTASKCVSRAVCPMGLEATFESIRTKIFAVSCGTTGSGCHSHDGGNDSGGLILADDPYTALLGADGKGATAYNIAGNTKNLRRVAPGDPDHSFLVIKLGTRTGQDPAYGSGMPFTDPGSVCPETLSTIRAWITAGAKQ